MNMKDDENGDAPAASGAFSTMSAGDITGLTLHIPFLVSVLLHVSSGEPQIGKNSPYPYNLPLKSSKHLSLARAANNKQKTLVVQIRSDHPVPLILKGRPSVAQLQGHSHAYSHAHLLSHAHGHHHTNVHHHTNAASTNHNHIRAQPRPMKLSAPIYLKNPSLMRKPLKLKLANSKGKPHSSRKPATSYDVPFKYEKPAEYASIELVQQLPLDIHESFTSNNFAPIYTIPAPNLSLQDNHLYSEETYLPPSSPKPQTLVDPLSGSQKFFAPDPDPSLPATQVRPATEPFNRPSNGKLLPSDVQSNQLPIAQPLVQIVGAHTANQIIPEIYPIQFSQTAQLQPFLGSNIAAVQPAHIPIYNPTYLVTQSNNLFNQHQQQLFKPAAIATAPIVQSGYVNADLTQEVASDGQILQAAKDAHNNIHPVLDVAPHFAPLIAAPALDVEHQALETAPFQLSNVAVSASPVSGSTEAGFVISNYYGNNNHDTTQLLEAYAEEKHAEAQRQHYEAFNEQLRQQQQRHLQEEQDLQQQHQFVQQHSQPHVPSAQPLQQEPHNAAFEEHERLVKQQLGENTPLRIFVPDEDEVRLQKRSHENIEQIENDIGDQLQDDLIEELASRVPSSETHRQNTSSD